MSLAPLSSRDRRRLRIGGWAFIVLSAVLALNFGTLGAQASNWPTLRWPVTIAVATNATPQPLPSLPDKPIDFGPPPPTAAPTPFVAPTAVPQENYPTKGGPITLQLNGNATLGGRLNASSQGAADNGSSTSAGFFVTLARRTPGSALRLTMPIGFTGTNATFGEMAGGFDAAHFSLNYQAQTIGALGQLPLGTTLRGPGVSFPTRYGDALIFAGPAIADDARGFNARAARLRVLLPRGFAALSAFDAHAQDGVGHIAGVSAGYASVPGRIDGTFEGALERTSSLHSVADGTSFAYQMRGDYGSPTTYATLVVRKLPAGFAPLTPIAAGSDALESLTLRTNPGALALNMETSFERTGDVTGFILDRRSSLALGIPFGSHIATNVFVNDERLIQATQRQWNGNLNLAAVWALPALSVQGTAQVGRSTVDNGAPSSSSGYSLGATRYYKGTSYDLSYLHTRNDLIGSRDTASTLRLGASRLRGRSVLSLASSLTRTLTGAVDQTVFNEIAEVARRLSPALTLNAQGSLQIVRDHLHSAGSNTSAHFNVTLGTPFSFGNGAPSGRIDPRLPATISGTIINDGATFSASNNALPSGVGGVNVILDGRQTQRTDAQGRFEFRSVRGGRHEVAIDPASLPRGVTADQPYVDVSLQGGQTAQLSLGVGAFGVIEGRVFGRDRAGTIFPIPDVSLQIDEIHEARTTVNGYYGIGRLEPGSHVIEIRAGSFPATVGLIDETRRTVVLHGGERVELDFRAEPLGSISGRVVSDGNGGAPAGVGLPNVYVVANPGDHAAITNDDGTYSIDNLAPGNYTLAVDEETLPSTDTGVVGGPKDTLALHASEVRDGVLFTVGHKERPIDFTYGKNETVGGIVLGREVLPPGGTTSLSISGIARDRTPVIHGFSHTIAALYDARRGIWRAKIAVPLGASAGVAAIDVQTGDSSLQAKLRVDPLLPIATFIVTPARPVRGQYVHVRARFLTEIAAGDRIVWSDAALTRLTSMRAGIVEFDVKIAEIPYRGVLITPAGRFGLVLVR